MFKGVAMGSCILPRWLSGKDPTANAGSILGQEDPLGRAESDNPCSVLPHWRSPWTGGPGGLQSKGSQRVDMMCD